MLISGPEHGDMWPSSTVSIEQAQANFAAFCIKHGILPVELIGMHARPEISKRRETITQASPGDLSTIYRRSLGQVASDAHIGANTLKIPRASYGIFAPQSSEYVPVTIHTPTYKALSLVRSPGVLVDVVRELSHYEEGRSDKFVFYVGPGNDRQVEQAICALDTHGINLNQITDSPEDTTVFEGGVVILRPGQAK